MRRMAGTDSLFLSLETPSWHQHVGGLTILQPVGPETVTFEQILARVAERIHLAPKFTWKLRTMPFGLHRPAWVDDPDFDVRRHVHRIGVPQPAGARELGEVSGMLLSSQLDRRKPLWELWFLEGLPERRVALLMKYHHCLLDGLAAASLATALMDLEPHPTSSLVEPPPKEEAEAGPEPGTAELLARSLVPDPAAPVRMARFAGNGVLKGLTAADRLRRDGENRALLRAPKTPFNGPIGPRRELAFASVALDDVRRVKAACDAKVNDVVLALCSSALRSYLVKKDELPASPLVTAVPVSTRGEEEEVVDGQKLTMMFVSLATDLDDPLERLRAITRSTRSAKEMTKAVGARQIQSIGELASPLILSVAIRAAYETKLTSRTPVRVNTLISNVPGPPVPLYTCGAEVTGIYPSSVILDGMGLNITVFSYLDRIDFGLHVDPDLVPDVWDVAEAIPSALSELLVAADLPGPTPVKDPFRTAASAP
jgi:diacylglycerol O-acyltransferase